MRQANGNLTSKGKQFCTSKLIPKGFSNGKVNFIKAATSENNSVTSTEDTDISEGFQYESTEKAVKKIMGHVEKTVEKLGVVHEDLMKECLRILLKLSVKIHFLFTGRPYKGIAAGLLLLISRKLNIPVPLRQIVKASKIKSRIIYRCVNIMKRHVPETISYVAKPINYLKRIAYKLRFD